MTHEGGPKELLQVHVSVREVDSEEFDVQDLETSRSREGEVERTLETALFLSWWAISEVESEDLEFVEGEEMVDSGGFGGLGGEMMKSG